jgi:hypothetical protein
MTEIDGALPNRVVVTKAMLQRSIPPQRLQDEIAKAEGRPYKDVYEAQPFRCEAFRVLLREYPGRDVTSLWYHAYDVEVELLDDSPTNGSSPTPALLSADTGGASPEISTS